MMQPRGASKIRGVHLAIVVDNRDGDSNPGYRVKLKLPWLNEQETTFWARIAIPMAGPDRGTYVLPEIDDQVLVVFEHGDVHRPIVIGALWSKKQEPVEVNRSGENNTKLIKSRCGHRIIFDDKAGAEKITIVDKTKKNKIVLDSASKVIKIESDGDIEIKAKSNVVLHSHALKVGASEAVTGKARSLLVHAASTFGLKATGGITIGGGTTTINVSSAAATRVSGAGAGELGAPGAEAPKDQVEQRKPSGGGGGGGGSAAAGGSTATSTSAGASPAPVSIDAHRIEIEIVNAAGQPEAGVQWELRLPGNVVRAGTTGGDGLIQIDNLSTAGEAHLVLPAFDDEKGRVDGARTPGATLYRAGGVAAQVGQHTVVELEPRVFRGRLIGMHFELDKTFLLPSALEGIRMVVRYYDEHPGSRIVINGHADSVGSRAYNVTLSDQRAAAIAAYLTDDVARWSRFYTSAPAGQPWGITEDQHMLSALGMFSDAVDGNDSTSYRAAIRSFREANNLAPLAGPANESLRKELIRQYMALDGTTMHGVAEMTFHGCGENHPVPGHEGGNRNDEANRRVEIFFFEDAIDPPRPATCPSPSGCTAYPAWVERTVQTVDFEHAAGTFDGFAFDAQAARLAVAGASVHLSGPSSVSGTTDGQGRVHFDNLIPGTYSVTVHKAGFADVMLDVDIASGPAAGAIDLPLVALALTLVAVPASAAGISGEIFVGRDPLRLRASASPPGGELAWRVVGPSGVVRIDGTADVADVTLRADDISTTRDDVEVICTYSLGSDVEQRIKLTALRVHLDVDADRDGVVEADHPQKATWTWGKAGAGAIVLCNCDDDDGKGSPDNTDDVVNGTDDVADLAPIVVRRAGPLKATQQLVLVSSSNRARWRIFDRRATGAAVAIGPSSPTGEFVIPNPAAEHTLGVEAVDFPDDGNSEFLDLALVLRDGATELARDPVQLRVAPWLIASHNEAATRIFVDNTGETAANGLWDQTPFLSGVRTLAAAAGCALVEDTNALRRVDRWMQDGMEIGFTSMPGKGMHVVFRNARNRENDGFSRTLLARDVGWFTKGTSDASFNYGGNLETSPPVTVAGTKFPLGRLIYGASSRPLETMDIAPFLRAQQVQRSLELDTTWLTVGHVDEFLTFLPAPGGFRLVMASAKLAVDILAKLQAAGDGGAPVFSGREEVDSSGAGVASLETTVDALLADAALMSFNTTIAGHIAAERAKLVAGLGIADSDIIDLPVLYAENPSSPGQADAHTGGVVNMLVVNGHCGIAKAFGPVVAGKDQFEEDVRAKLTPLGLTLHFIDDWYSYHIQLGEIHCGTNTERSANMFNWWEFEP